MLHIRFLLPMEYTFPWYTFHYSKFVEIQVKAFKVKSRRVNVLWSVISNYGLVWKSLLDLKWFKWHLANVFLFRNRQIICSQVYSFIPDDEIERFIIQFIDIHTMYIVFLTIVWQSIRYKMGMKWPFLLWSLKNIKLWFMMVMNKTKDVHNRNSAKWKYYI